MNTEKKLGKRGTTVLMADGSQVEDVNALRDNDHLYIFWGQMSSENTIVNAMSYFLYYMHIYKHVNMILSGRCKITGEPWNLSWYDDH